MRDGRVLVAPCIELQLRPARAHYCEQFMIKTSAHRGIAFATVPTVSKRTQLEQFRAKQRSA